MARDTVTVETDAFDSVRKMASPDREAVWKKVGSTSHVIDSVPFHNVADDWQFRTRVPRPGDIAVYRFDSTGIYESYCSLEGREMCGVIPVGGVSLADPLPCEDPGE